MIAGIAFAANSDVFNTEKISGFGNYDEVNSKITELEKESSVSEGGCGIFNTTLVKDEENVEKPDVVKTDGEYIYCAYFDVEGYTNRNKVYIYKIQDTRDPNLGKVMLYQLSYFRIVCFSFASAKVVQIFILPNISGEKFNYGCKFYYRLYRRHIV